MQGPSQELTIGDRAPDFVLPGPDDKFYQFYERTRGRPQILFFYPGKNSDAWSQVENLARCFNEFERLGVDIFGVNLDPCNGQIPDSLFILSCKFALRISTPIKPPFERPRITPLAPDNIPPCDAVRFVPLTPPLCLYTRI